MVTNIIRLESWVDKVLTPSTVGDARVPFDGHVKAVEEAIASIGRNEGL